jgi:hypothetical protein
MTLPATTNVLRPPGVIHELIEMLQASPVSSDETLIRWGLLPELPTQRERVYLLGVTDYVLAPNTRAHRVRREDFGIRGLIEVAQLGDNNGPEDSATRAWELLTGLDHALYQDQSLTDGTRYSGALNVVADEVVPTSDGWLARIIFTLIMEAVR